MNTVKKKYAEPQVVEYGRIDELTLGDGGSLPDFDANFNLRNVNCPTATLAGGGTRVACINTFS